MGYEELGSHQPGSQDGPHGSSVRRTAGLPAAGPVVNLAVDLAQPQVEPPRPPRSPRRRTALLAAAIVAGAAALVVQHGGGSAVTPTAAPTPRADFPTDLPTTAVRTPPLSTSTDLTTVVTRAQLHLATAPTGSEVEAIRLQFDRVDLGASYGFRASDPARGDLEPGEVLAASAGTTAADAGTGVTVFFDGVLTPRASTRLTRVLEEVGPARGWVVAQVPGTTVDISVPLNAGPNACVRANGFISDRGLAAPSTALPFYGFRVADDRLVISYTGPQLSWDRLAAVGSRLARSCDQPATAVTYTRPVG